MKQESRDFSHVRFNFAWFDKDVSSLVTVAALIFAGYRVLASFYIWMAKNEHVMDKKIEYKKLGLDSSNLDIEEENLDNETFEESDV